MAGGFRSFTFFLGWFIEIDPYHVFRSALTLVRHATSGFYCLFASELKLLNFIFSSNFFPFKLVSEWEPSFFSIVDNIGEDNNLVGIDCRDEALEVALERHLEEQHEKLWRIDAMISRLTLNDNTRRVEAARGHARILAQGALVAWY